MIAENEELHIRRSTISNGVDTPISPLFWVMCVCVLATSLFALGAVSVYRNGDDSATEFSANDFDSTYNDVWNGGENPLDSPIGSTTPGSTIPVVEATRDLGDPPASQWLAYESSDGTFVSWFPSEPTITSEPLNFEGRHGTRVETFATGDGVSFVVDNTLLEIEPADAEGFIFASMANFSKLVGREVTFTDIAATDAGTEASGRTDVGTSAVIVRFIYTGKIFHAVTASVLPDAPDKEAALFKSQRAVNMYTPIR